MRNPSGWVDVTVAGFLLTIALLLWLYGQVH